MGSADHRLRARTVSFRPGFTHLVLAVRRLSAAVLDIALFLSFMWVTGVIAYPMTGGLVRHRDTHFVSRDCIDVNLPPVEAPAWIRPTDARLCRTHALGLTVDRSFVLEGVNPTTSAPASWSVAANSKGQPAAAIYLDEIRFALMIFFFAGLESLSGWTFGKHLLGARVLDAREKRPLTFYRALERNGLIYGPLAIAELTSIVAMNLSPLGPYAPFVPWFWYGAVGWIMLGALLTLAARPRSLFDRWSGIVVEG